MTGIDNTEASLSLTAYMDETGHSEDPRLRFAGMAGFVAPMAAWDGLGNYWKDVMKHFKLIEPFHMKEFAHFQGQFVGWKGNEQRRKDLLNALVTGLVAIRPVPVGVIISVEDYRTLSERQQKAFKDPYYIAFQRCTRGAALEGLDMEPNKVDMVYSYNHEFGALKPQSVYSVDQAGHAEQLWRIMKESTDFGRWMGEYNSQTPAEAVQLQVADLFAYELSKEFENLRLRPKDPMRWALRQLIQLVDYPFGYISLLDRLELLRIIKESHWPCRENTEEVGDVEAQTDFARARMTRWLRDRGGLGERIEDTDL